MTKHKILRLYLAAATAAQLVEATANADAIDWPLLRFTEMVTNRFSAPTCIAHAGDGSQRLFVVEQAGYIWTIQSNAVLARPFLEMTNRALSGGERGLLGLAFPPSSSSNGHFYVDYTRKPDGATVISRFQVTDAPSVADPTSEEVLMVISQPFANHNGGQLAFGPDGYLYIGMGDGGSGGDPLNNAQNPASLLGKILRIDVENGGNPYRIPASNPFLTDPEFAPEIWAMGLRNPWRFSFDRNTGDLYIADVGQESMEEINFQPANSPGGQNYGWRLKEGTADGNLAGALVSPNTLTLPVATYERLLGGSVTGGYVCRDANGGRLQGIYIFGDWVSRRIFGLKFDGDWKLADLGIGPGAASTFGEDEAGRLYLADYFGGGLFRIEDSAVAFPPSFSPPSGNSPTAVITLNSLTPNSTMRYTFEPRNPLESDPAASPGQQIAITNGTTIRAQTLRADLFPSLVSTGLFNFVVARPEFEEIPSTALFWPVRSNTLVTISCATPGAAIYYTLNSSIPTTNTASGTSFLYTEPFVVTPIRRVIARAFLPTFGPDSPVRSVTFQLASVPMPGIRPASGPITNGTEIKMGCAYESAEIFYTLDGSTPTTDSPKYTGPFAIPGNTTVKARAFLTNYQASAINTITFSLPVVATPAYTPALGPITNGTSISITCATPGAAIFFTVDGTEPTTNSILYSAPIEIAGNTRLKARAFAPESNPSNIRDVFYPLVPAGMPVLSPAVGPVTNGTAVTIHSATPDAMIRYTVDGSDPQPDSPLYNQALLISPPVTLKARAYRNDLDPSQVKAIFYGLLSPENSVVTTVAGGLRAGFQNGPGTVAEFNLPQAVCIDPAGNLYVADTGNHVIRKISSTGEVSTFAGTGVAGSQLGSRTDAQFYGPTGVCLDDAGNVYVADSENCNRICKIDTNGVVTVFANVTLCGPGIGNYASALWQLKTGPDGNLYGGFWFGLRKILQDGTVVLLAGPGCNCPGGWARNVGPGVDAATNLYSATGGNLWKTTADGNTELFAGGAAGVSDGPRLAAGFFGLQDATVDARTNIFLSDTTRIARMRLEGWVSTWAGLGIAGYRNGRGSQAQLRNATGLCVDTNGNLYVADSENHCIRKISPDTAGIGIADDWQRAHFGLVGVDPNDDPDNDGMSNYGEFWSGTDPNDANSVLAINSATIATNGLTQISWQSVSGKTYTLKYSDDLITWKVLGSSVPASGTTTSSADSTMGGLTQRFYRVFVEF
jgi:glucose/arabinose dehydrogenase/sugar lactone lactonase YvrE